MDQIFLSDGPNSVIFWKTISWILWGIILFLTPFVSRYVKIVWDNYKDKKVLRDDLREFKDQDYNRLKEKIEEFIDEEFLQFKELIFKQIQEIKDQHVDINKCVTILLDRDTKKGGSELLGLLETYNSKNEILKQLTIQGLNSHIIDKYDEKD